MNNNVIDLKHFFKLLLSDKIRIIGITLIILIIGILYIIYSTPLYQSSITMYPSNINGSSQLNQFQGFASTFGFDLGSQESSLSIIDIVNSRRIKTKLIYHKWSSSKFNKSINLIDYWGYSDTTNLQSNFNPIKYLQGLLSEGDNSIDFMSQWELLAINKLADRIQINQSKTGLITISILN